MIPKTGPCRIRSPVSAVRAKLAGSGGRWAELSLAEQMANIGSEVGRALRWRGKGNTELAARASIRALELLGLSPGAGPVLYSPR